MHTPVTTRRWIECHINWPIAFGVGTYLKTSRRSILEMEGKESFVDFTRSRVWRLLLSRLLHLWRQSLQPQGQLVCCAIFKYKWSLDWQLLDLNAVISLYIKLKFMCNVVGYFFPCTYMSSWHWSANWRGTLCTDHCRKMSIAIKEGTLTRQNIIKHTFYFDIWQDFLVLLLFLHFPLIVYWYFKLFTDLIVLYL